MNGVQVQKSQVITMFLTCLYSHFPTTFLPFIDLILRAELNSLYLRQEMKYILKVNETIGINEVIKIESFPLIGFSTVY